jgi:hypothetical protein
MVPPKGGATEELFSKAANETLFHKIFKNNMDSESYVNIQEGLEKTASLSKQAYFTIRDNVLENSEFDCKVTGAITFS